MSDTELDQLTAGTPTHAQVDSANADTTYSGVLEGYEIISQAYNKIEGPVLSIAP